ncbi:palmitoyltransferase ZDHHC20-like [Mercenaria mercenaria]|uniref:palmitoyltransferase ZDHHC20-like n=1 Tax=Mercenaria mercenaria TaxID=6596 RepID=UPI00234E7973|nr:palmitoyltransferase ZDHHC20-like [Mercenaria mercenaria]
MEKIKERIERCMTARPHTDLQSEILNVIAAPIYLYTITGVFYYSCVFIMPYYYGSGTWTLFLHRSLLLVIYFQMMSNWLCIRLVDNSLKTASKHFSINKGSHHKDNESELQGIVVNGTNQAMKSSIPGPVSAPSTPRRSSYWSWRLCKKCELTAPPRCHHCPFCDNCILKRDHHCFFTRRCIGFYNQRHFVVFLVRAMFGTSYTSVYFVPYLFKVVLLSA